MLSEEEKYKACLEVGYGEFHGEYMVSLVFTLYIFLCWNFYLFFVLGIVDAQAEQWVNNMTRVEEDKPTGVESEGRPSRSHNSLYYLFFVSS